MLFRAAERPYQTRLPTKKHPMVTNRPSIPNPIFKIAKKMALMTMSPQLLEAGLDFFAVSVGGAAVLAGGAAILPVPAGGSGGGTGAVPSA